MVLCCSGSRRRSSTAMGELSKSQSASKNISNKVLIEIKQLEDKTHFFTTYLLPDYLDEMNRELAIVSQMNVLTEDILRTNIELLDDIPKALLIVNAFYLSKGLVTQWQKSTDPLFSGLLVCFILRKLRMTFDNLHETTISAEYKKAKKKMEDRVVNLLRECYESNDEQTIKVLEEDYHAELEHHEHIKGFCQRLTLLDLALITKCEKFLDHKACRIVMDARFRPGFTVSFISGFFCILLIPIFFRVQFRDRRGKTIGALNRRQSNQYTAAISHYRRKIKTNRSFFGIFVDDVKKWAKRIKQFYVSPFAIFILHTIFYVLYVLTFAALLITWTDHPFSITEGSKHWLKILVFWWQLSFMLDMGYGMFKDPYYFDRNPADITHNAANFLAWNCLLLSLVLRDAPFYHPILASWLFGFAYSCFYFSFIFSTLRTMRVFAADSFFGAVVLMIRKLARLMISFFVVFILFWFAFAVSVNSLIGLKSNHTIAWKLFSSGAFEIFGELQDSQRHGELDEITGCSSLRMEGNELTDVWIQCNFRSWAVPLLLFGYVFVVTILLVNIVVAFFTSTYDEVRENSLLYFRYKQYERLVEYESAWKIWLPPPFSPFVLLFFLLCRLLSPIFSGFHRCWRRCMPQRVQEAMHPYDTHPAAAKTSSTLHEEYHRATVAGGQRLISRTQSQLSTISSGRVLPASIRMGQTLSASEDEAEPSEDVAETSAAGEGTTVGKLENTEFVNKNMRTMVWKRVRKGAAGGRRQFLRYRVNKQNASRSPVRRGVEISIQTETEDPSSSSQHDHFYHLSSPQT